MVEMKKVWSRPLTVVQNFEANEYVAACYSGTCNITCGPYYSWNDKDGDGQVDYDLNPLNPSNEVNLWEPVAMSNKACDAEFNGAGSITPVAYYDEAQNKWCSAWYFKGITPQTGRLSTHVTDNYTVTNASC